MARRQPRPSNNPDEAAARGFSRRMLLGGLGATGAAVAGAAVAGSASDEAGDRPTQPGREPVYRETEHIRRFYARSRF